VLRSFDGYVILTGILHQVVSTLKPSQKIGVSPWRDHLHAGVQAVHGRLKPHLVVSLQTASTPKSTERRQFAYKGGLCATDEEVSHRVLAQIKTRGIAPHQ